MAAPRRTPRARPTHIYPPSDHSAAYSDAYDDDMPFEFDEADVWSNGDVARVPSFETIRSNGVATPGSCAPRRPPRRADISSDPKPAAASLPVNIPDWSKINMTPDHADGGGRVESDDEGEDDRESRVPPHEYLARRRGASLSVHEGIGRTLKGRDLRRVRDAIWKSVGFTD
ncbi:protein S40-4 [Syzygium oleosum]|uniref:protein S40-4 n=1 Tax=Syzygium oleosum TaxID=219896 RepID=UPI0024BA154D|nr:protein S40-4 [Syzygium oleosum]